MKHPVLPVEIVLAPDWWHHHEGITFDEDFFYHPDKRVAVERQMEKVLYDRFGRQVPSDIVREYRKAEAAGRAPSTLNGPDRNYVGPFVGVDRERDLRLAHAHFSRIAAARARTLA